GDGLLNRMVTWANVFYPENRTTGKIIQRGEIVLVPPPETESSRNTSDADIVRGIIGVWMSDTMRADSFHHALVVSPVQRPRSHVVVGWVVDAAVFSAALHFIMRFE
ncbi:hypothetical protein, partial [Undibacterium luofuense]|uniref:hypothetical protein n=1 Tax=Undibacterium luofuense TaxID=2828733 RepID=UPI0030EE96B2